MRKSRNKAIQVLVGFGAVLLTSSTLAQVASKGLTPPANTYSAYQDASIARDSRLNRPLDLLNDFYPAIEVTITDHDNVRRRPDVDEPDLKIVIKPVLAYRTNIGRHQFYAAYSGSYIWHEDLEQEDAESNALTAALGLDLSRHWDVDVFGKVGESYEQRGISGSRDFDRFVNNGFDSGPEETDYRSYGADLVYGRKIDILTAVLGFEHEDTDFASDDLLFDAQAADRDRSSDSVHLDLNWRFGQSTSVFGRIQQTDTDYDTETNTLDSEQTDYLIGLRWKPANTLSGVVGVGRTDRDYDDPTRHGYDGSSYYTNLSYRIRPFSIIELAASRTVEESNDPDASFYDSEYFGIGWNHSITARWVFDVYAKWIDDDYDIGREDQFFDWGLGVDYVWRDWLTAGVYYGEIERDSTRDDVDYEDRFIGIRLRSDLRNLFGGGRREPVVEPDSFDYPKRTESAQ